jgi:hypothetical protein
MSERSVTIPLSEFEELQKAQQAVQEAKTVKVERYGGYINGYTSYKILDKDETIHALFLRIAELERQNEALFQKTQKRWFK